MKKFLSALLVFTLILSTLCILPVAATEEYDLVIENQDDWDAFVTDYATYADKNIKLNCNVTATATLAAFSGTFDGGNNTITVSAPLFASLDGATVKNLTLAGNVTASSGTTLAALSLGATGTVAIERCVNKATVSLTTNANFNVGAFVAFCESGLTALNITACVNIGDVTVDVGANNLNGTASGFVGRCNTGTTTIAKCLNQGDMKVMGTLANASHRVAGIYGANAAPATITDCVNLGKISSMALGGGIIGEARKDATITNCYNYGLVNGGKIDDAITNAVNCQTGGIVGGFSQAGTLNIVACTNYGEIQATEFKNASANTIRVGGIIGCISHASAVTNVTESYSMADVTGTMNSGGIVGRLHNGKCNVSASFIDATVTGGEKQTGMLYGFNNDKEFIVDAATKYVATGEGDNVIASEAAWIASLPIKGIGYQTTAVSNGAYNVRFVSTIAEGELGNYDKVGYEVIRYTATTAGATSNETDTVYSSLYGVDDYTDGANMGEKTSYYSTFVVTGVPADETVTFVVRPYVVSGSGDDAVVTYGNAFTVALEPAV